MTSRKTYHSDITKEKHLSTFQRYQILNKEGLLSNMKSGHQDLIQQLDNWLILQEHSLKGGYTKENLIRKALFKHNNNAYSTIVLNTNLFLEKFH